MGHTQPVLACMPRTRAAAGAARLRHLAARPTLTASASASATTTGRGRARRWRGSSCGSGWPTGRSRQVRLHAELRCAGSVAGHGGLYGDQRGPHQWPHVKPKLQAAAACPPRAGDWKKRSQHAACKQHPNCTCLCSAHPHCVHMCVCLQTPERPWRRCVLQQTGHQWAPQRASTCILLPSGWCIIWCNDHQHAHCVLPASRLETGILGPVAPWSVSCSGRQAGRAP